MKYSQVHRQHFTRGKQKQEIRIIFLSINTQYVLILTSSPAGVHTGGCGHSGRHRPDHRGDHLPQAQAAARQEDGDCQDRLHQVEGDHRGEAAAGLGSNWWTLYGYK